MVEDVLFEPDGPQLRLDYTASQLSGVHNSLMVDNELLDQHRERSAAGPFCLSRCSRLSFPFPSLGSPARCVKSGLLVVRGLQMYSSQRLESGSWNRGPLWSCYMQLSEGVECIPLALRHEGRLLRFPWSSVTIELPVSRAFSLSTCAVLNM